MEQNKNTHTCSSLVLIEFQEECFDAQLRCETGSAASNPRNTPQKRHIVGNGHRSDLKALIPRGPCIHLNYVDLCSFWRHWRMRGPDDQAIRMGHPGQHAGILNLKRRGHQRT